MPGPTARPPAVHYGIFIFRPMHVDERSSLAPTLFINCCNIAGGKICVNRTDWSAVLASKLKHALDNHVVYP